MRIHLSDDRRARVVTAVKRHFDSEFDEDKLADIEGEIHEPEPTR